MLLFVTFFCFRVTLFRCFFRLIEQMSMVDQAVLFYLFAAFTGHDGVIAEAARLTDERPILDESVKQKISDLLQLAATDSNLVLNIVYFVPDARKAGGSYKELTGAHQEAPTARKVAYHGLRHPHPGGGYCRSLQKLKGAP